MLNKRRQTVSHFRMKENATPKEFATLPHILVVDDDDRIRNLVARYLREHDFFVSTAENAAQAKEILAMAKYDALVVDIMMPGQTGMEFTQDLRDLGVYGQHDIPVLLLTAMGEVDDKIEGLSAGADDYLTKPFDPRELVLRLQAILRRRPKVQKTDHKLRIGDWVFDPEYNELLDEENDRSIKLTDGEATLLKALGQKAGEVMSREAL